MNKDFRVSTGFMGNKKTVRVIRSLGMEGVAGILNLWSYTAINKPSGILDGMDETDIEIAAQWSGEPGKFFQAIRDEKSNFIDCLDGKYVVHDWLEHNPYCAGAEDRSQKAKKAAEKRWSKDHDAPGEEAAKPKEETGNAKGDTEQCYAHSGALLNSPTGNAPSPAPYPSPLPDPSPSPEPGGDARAGEAESEISENSKTPDPLEEPPWLFPELTEGVLGKTRDRFQHSKSVIRDVEFQFREAPEAIEIALKWFLDQEGMPPIFKLRDKCRWVLDDLLNRRARASPTGRNGTSEHDKRFAHLAHKKSLR